MLHPMPFSSFHFISFHFSSYRQNQSDGSCHRARNIFWRRDFESPMFAHPSVASYSREGGPFFLAPISIQSEERGKDCCSPVLHTVPDIYTHTHTPHSLTRTPTGRPGFGDYSFGGWLKCVVVRDWSNRLWFGGELRNQGSDGLEGVVWLRTT